MGDPMAEEDPLFCTDAPTPKDERHTEGIDHLPIPHAILF
jgi:hypothetical protein